MARLKKTKGVELVRFENAAGTIRIALFSYGIKLRNTKNPPQFCDWRAKFVPGGWGGWKRDGKWKIGTIKATRADYVSKGWKEIKEFK